jgi:hypothetical protein
LALVFFLCALFSKTVTCSLPAVLLLVSWWKRGRVGARDVLALTLLFILGAPLSARTAWQEETKGACVDEWSLSLLQRGLLAGGPCGSTPPSWRGRGRSSFSTRLGSSTRPRPGSTSTRPRPWRRSASIPGKEHLSSSPTAARPRYVSAIYSKMGSHKVQLSRLTNLGIALEELLRLLGDELTVAPSWVRMKEGVMSG